jgi:hypothetical protein
VDKEQENVGRVDKDKVKAGPVKVRGEGVGAEADKPEDGVAGRVAVWEDQRQPARRAHACAPNAGIGSRTRGEFHAAICNARSVAAS